MFDPVALIVCGLNVSVVSFDRFPLLSNNHQEPGCGAPTNTTGRSSLNKVAERIFCIRGSVRVVDPIIEMEGDTFDFHVSDQYAPGKELTAWNRFTVGIVTIPVDVKPV